MADDEDNIRTSVRGKLKEIREGKDGNGKGPPPDNGGGDDDHGRNNDRKHPNNNGPKR